MQLYYSFAGNRWKFHNTQQYLQEDRVMENTYAKGYDEFMEEALQAMVQLPVEGICIITKLQGGGVLPTISNPT